MSMFAQMIVAVIRSLAYTHAAVVPSRPDMKTTATNLESTALRLSRND